MTWSAGAFSELGLIPSVHRMPIPHGPQDIATLIDSAVADTPYRQALIGRYSRYTYVELDREVNAAAAAIDSLGISEGDRVAFSAPNHSEIIIAFLATQRLGAIWVGVSQMLSASEKECILSDCGVTLLFADSATATSLGTSSAGRRIVVVQPGTGDEWSSLISGHRGAARPDVDVDRFAPAVIAYTSGTTGSPKGAVHSQHALALVAGSRMVQRPWAIGKIAGCALALTNINQILLGPVPVFASGGTIVCIDRTHLWEIREWVRRESIDYIGLVGPLVFDIVKDPTAVADLGTLRNGSVGGSHLTAKLLEEFADKLGFELSFGYGLTEAPATVAATIPGQKYPSSALGPWYEHLDLAILDEDDQPVPQGEVGEIAVRAVRDGLWANVYTPPLGYWKRPEETASMLRNGWLHSGDLGWVDAESNLFIKDRKEEMINRGGANVYPGEIERVIAADPRILDCAVVGKSDPRLGEQVVAVIQSTAAVEARSELEQDLRRRCEQALARYKVPVKWHFLETIPRNSMGKIVKARLKEIVNEWA